MDLNIVTRRKECIKVHNEHLNEIKGEFKEWLEVHESNLNLKEIMKEITKLSNHRDLIRTESSKYNAQYFDVYANLQVLKQQQTEAKEQTQFLNKQVTVAQVNHEKQKIRLHQLDEEKALLESELNEISQAEEFSGDLNKTIENIITSSSREKNTNKYYDL